jgi:hypothetical protein
MGPPGEDADDLRRSSPTSSWSGPRELIVRAASLAPGSTYARTAARERHSVIRVRAGESVDTLFELLERSIEELDQEVVRGKAKSRAGNSDEAVPSACEIVRRLSAMLRLGDELHRAVLRAGVLQSLR